MHSISARYRYNFHVTNTNLSKYLKRVYYSGIKFFNKLPPNIKSFYFPEGGVGLVPKCGCLLTLAYYAFPRWYEFGDWWWNDILTEENRRTRGKNCPSATNPTWIDLGVNPGLRGERLATNDLSHGTAHHHHSEHGQGLGLKTHQKFKLWYKNV
jgi:hypothetical protein